MHIGAADEPSDKYSKAAALADALARDVHYTVDEKQKAVLITDEGYEAAEDVLEVRAQLAGHVPVQYTNWEPRVV